MRGVTVILDPTGHRQGQRPCQQSVITISVLWLCTRRCFIFHSSPCLYVVGIRLYFCFPWGNQFSQTTSLALKVGGSKSLRVLVMACGLFLSANQLNLTWLLIHFISVDLHELTATSTAISRQFLDLLHILLSSSYAFYHKLIVDTLTLRDLDLRVLLSLSLSHFLNSNLCHKHKCLCLEAS